MGNKLIIFLGLIALLSCKEKVAKLVFDSSKITNISLYSYEYDFDKLKSESVKSYIYMNGIVIDSFNRETNFFYNGNGLKEKEISYSSNEKEPSVRLYRYDSNDSVILDLTINEEKDTIYWSEFKYFPDGRRIVFKRDIVPGFVNDSSLINDLEIPRWIRFCIDSNLTILTINASFHINLIKIMKRLNLSDIAIKMIY